MFAPQNHFDREASTWAHHHRRRSVSSSGASPVASRRTKAACRRNDWISVQHQAGRSPRGSLSRGAMSPDEQSAAGRAAQGGVGGASQSSQRQQRRRVENSEKVPVAQQALTKFLELPTVPIGSYVSSPVSVLHWLDPRVKQAWLAVLLLFPPNGTPEEKVCVCVALALATAATLPTRVWRPQLTTLTSVCAVLFAFMVVGADSVMPVIQPREPPAVAEGLLALPQLEHAYRYVLVHFGPLQVTRRGVNLAVSSSCLTFTVLQSAHLTLCTTTPEAMASGIRWYLRPLAVFRAPVDELVFTLLLSLRFTAIVFEEVRNISLGLAARGVDWRALGWRGTISTFSSLLSRTLESLFSTSSAVADAVTARGFKGAERHRFFTPPGVTAAAQKVFFSRVGNFAAMVTLFAFVAHFTDFDYTSAREVFF